MNPLFPVVGNSDQKQCSTSSLFPVSVPPSTVEQDKEGIKSDLDWLHNPSYKQGTQSDRLVSHDEESVIYQKDRDHEDEEHHQEDSDNSSISPKRKTNTRVEDNDGHHGHKKRKKEKHKHKHKKHKHRHEAKSPPPAEVKKIDKTPFVHSSNKIFIEEIPGLDAKDAFRIDRKPDKNTLIYGSLYKMHVAQYKQHMKTCLASGNRRDIYVKDKYGGHKDVSDIQRYYDRANRKQLRVAPLQRFAQNSKKTNILEVCPKEFIQIKESGTESSSVSVVTTQGMDVRDKLLDRNTQAYLHGKQQVTPENSAEVKPIQCSELWQLTAEFNRKTRENPKDVQVWLDFVKFQDRFEYQDMLDETFTVSQRKLPKQIITEKKILILQKAIDANPNCLALKLKYLDLCQENLETDKVRKEIQILIRDNPLSIELWKRYLEFSQSRMSVFSISGSTKLYHECFRSLMSIQEETPNMSTEHERNLIDIFIQYCHFLKQAGHTEKAVACFQALLEFNLCVPPSLSDADKGSRLAIFESFWDSGVSRIGEKGAKGWNYWVGHKGEIDQESTPQEVPQTASEEAELKIITHADCRWKSWFGIEKLRESLHWLPWRPDLYNNETEEDCEDLDRLVLFDDIAPAIFEVKTVNLKMELVLQFLNFLGVNVGDSLLPVSMKSTESQLNMDRPSQVMLVSDAALLSLPFQGKDEHISNILKVFINNLFMHLLATQCFDKPSKCFLTTLWFRFQTNKHLQEPSDVKQLKKFAKNILKETDNRSNLFVWCEYVNQLRCLWGIKDAKAVVEMAFSLQGTIKNTDSIVVKCGFSKLYLEHIEMVLALPPQGHSQWGTRSGQIPSNQISDAVKSLICFVEGKQFMERTKMDTGSTSTLKARRKFEELVSSALQDMSSGRDKNMSLVFSCEYFCVLVKCFAVFSWCTTQELDKCIQVMDNALSSIKQCQMSAENTASSPLQQNFVQSMEELHKFKIRFIQHLMSFSCLSLGHLRDAVKCALNDFSNHSYFLSVFIDMEQRSYITGRLDRYFNFGLRDTLSPVTVVHAVFTQIRRFQLLEKHDCQDSSKPSSITESSVLKFGLIHRVRSYLEKSLSHLEIQHCPLVWRLYMYTEMKYGEKERAKGLFYRSLQQCPWSKVLYTDGVWIFGEDKLEDIADLLLEKELRIQIPLEELDILIEQLKT